MGVSTRQQPIYELFVTDSSGNVIELSYLSLNFTHELNVGKDAKFTLSYRDIEKIAEAYSTTVLFMLTSGQREVKVTKNGTNIFIGIVTDFIIRKDDKSLLVIDLAAVGFSTILKKRRTDDVRQFVATDAGTIAWTLIDESQNSMLPYSDLGITQGLIQTSVNRDKVYNFAQIHEELQKMTREKVVDGYDFEIDNLKQFNVFYPQKGSERPELFIDTGNIRQWGYRKPLILGLTTQVYVIGQGYDDAVLYTVRTSDTAYLNSFGLLEDSIQNREEVELANLNDAGDKWLNDNQSPIVELTIQHKDGDPDILNYDVGDSLRVTLAEVNVNNQYQRVKSRNIVIDTQNQAIVTLGFFNG